MEDTCTSSSMHAPPAPAPCMPLGCLTSVVCMCSQGRLLLLKACLEQVSPLQQRRGHLLLSHHLGQRAGGMAAGPWGSGQQAGFGN